MKRNKTLGGLISVIIPVYNSEDYLDDTINSIINQNYSNWELLLIDDGSTDMSAKICDRYALIDDRISAFHIQNSGVSHARNMGIKWSRGEFLVFCDSDDLISPAFLSIMKSQQESIDADIVRCTQKPIGETIHVFEDGSCTFDWKIYDNADIAVIPMSMYDVVWGKIFRKSLILDNKIVFDEYLNRGEDTLFVYETVLCSSRIVYSDCEYVNYRIREGSLMRSKVIKALLYEQSVHRYYRLCEFVLGRNLNECLFERIRRHVLCSIAENLVKSVADGIVFKKNYQNFCVDEKLQQSLNAAKGSFTRRIRISVFVMLMLQRKCPASFVRLLLKVI